MTDMTPRFTKTDIPGLYALHQDRGRESYWAQLWRVFRHGPVNFNTVVVTHRQAEQFLSFTFHAEVERSCEAHDA